MAVSENYKGEILYYTIDGFEDDRLEHLFSSREGWDQENIFKGVETIFGLEDERIYRASQVHGDDILIINDQNYEEVKDMELDGLVTDVKGLALSTYHADCTPIYFYDGKKEVIAMVHAGWRGTLKNIAKKMIITMEDEFGSRAEDIKVAIGPSICRDCYEVKEDVSGLFEEKYEAKDILKLNQGRIYLDLWKINKINLLNAGILRENISMAKFCTSCNTDKLYSYRKENATKNRMIASLMMKD